jgi:hypothetical protein
MNISLSQLKTERHWRSATGMDKPRFDKLLSAFKAAYERHFNRTLAERQVESPQECTLNGYEELLFFTLFSFKADLTYDLLGLVCGFDGSNAKRNEEIGITILKSALHDLGHTPVREFKSALEFKTYFSKNIKLIIDGTEQRRQRPVDFQSQQEMYSGKKKPIR